MKKLVVPGFCLLMLLFTFLSSSWIAGKRLQSNPQYLCKVVEKDVNLKEVTKLTGKKPKPSTEYFMNETHYIYLDGSNLGWSKKDSVVQSSYVVGRQIK